MAWVLGGGARFVPDWTCRLRAWGRRALLRAGFLTGLLERRLARRVCREVLRRYREVERELPALHGEARYLEVVARHLQADLRTASAVLEGAAASFAAWPEVRRLRFRDVAHYLASRECLQANPAAAGLSVHVPDIVARCIPPQL